ncbi:MAG: sodium:solute symporter family protein [Sphingobacteriia bacterium]
MITIWDWIILLAFVGASLGIALYASRQSGRSMGEFFLGGRQLPAWLAGLSIVATTFAADTPLLVTELVRTQGISGNWLWWNMLVGGMFTTFFFARLWHRAQITTDVELVSIRYSGPGARLLRPVKAIYFGLLLNAVIMAWVNLALVKIFQGLFGIAADEARLWTFGLLLLTAVYSLIGGLRGVVLTDAFQFLLAMGGCIVLAFLVLGSSQIGGISGLKAQLVASGQSSALWFFPQVGAQASGLQVLSISLASLLSFFGLQWWAAWYPGNEPGGGGYVAQRLMATRGEAQAQQASLIFQILHYCLRPWPWILVALASLVLYPQLDDPGLGYVLAMRDFLPEGLRGLLLAAFLAAYMSTISTQLNWGASYLIHDAYAPARPGLSARQLVGAGRLATLGLALVGMFVTLFMDSLGQAFLFLIEASAGLGGVLIARWYWHRVNAWAELVAMATPIVLMILLRWLAPELHAPYPFVLTALATTLCWVLAALLGPRTDPKVLAAFQARVRPMGSWPGGPGWLPTLRLAGRWLLSIVAAYSWLLAIGHLLLDLPRAYTLLALALLSSLLAALSLRSRSHPFA